MLLPKASSGVIVYAYIGVIMVNHPVTTSRFWLNAATVVRRLEEHHLTHADFADTLGLSRSYWSQLVHRKRPLSPQVRRALLAAPALTGLVEAQIWDRVPDGAQP
ncbi:MAG: helix-turn-helix transcriptional regulator [Myxococcota bacterium]